jgi:hypothetical protein
MKTPDGYTTLRGFRRTLRSFPHLPDRGLPTGASLRPSTPAIQVLTVVQIVDRV